MAEVGNMGLPPKLLRQGVKDMVRISDARMSGTAYGTVVLHVAPEAAAGGPLAAVRDGDFIELDRLPRIQATIGGVPMFDCQYGTHNSKYAIRIEKALRGNDQNWLGERHGH
jgi:hypothetical protein